MAQLSDPQVLDLVRELMEDGSGRAAEQDRLNRIRKYLRDDPDERRLEGLPPSIPPDVARLARVSRLNFLKLIVNTRVQGLYVDGFGTPEAAENSPVWKLWQANRMDARQIGIHRAAVAYGVAYNVVTPGTNGTAIRGVSPRKLTALYEDDDDDWPVYALQELGGGRWRLLDAEFSYDLVKKDDTWGVGLVQAHGGVFEGQPVCPVVRMRETRDLDDPVRGVVEPHMCTQDQINITTFGLLVAQHYGAFRQRYILGWLAESEEVRLKASASKLWTFEDADLKVGEFQQTQLDGYIQSREASMRHLATMAQSPVPELLGELINVSAEALAGTLDSHYRALGEEKTSLGEDWEQTLNLAAEMNGDAPEPDAQVKWRDTKVKSFAEIVPGLAILAEKLGVPAEELWSLVPTIDQSTVERWKKRAEEIEREKEAEAAANPPAPPVPGAQPPAQPGFGFGGEAPAPAQ